jgi:small-conductance mechanosensitive channel
MTEEAKAVTIADEAWHRFVVEVALFMPRLVLSVALVVAFWAVAVVASRLLGRLLALRGLDPDLTSLLTRAGRIALLAFGLVTALGTVGVDVKALVTGLGLTGFALGFALRDIISNTLSGILILAYKPFRRGERVSVAGSEGTIAEIDLRYTVLVGERDSRILIPNSTLFTNSITVSAGEHPRAEAATGGSTPQR